MMRRLLLLSVLAAGCLDVEKPRGGLTNVPVDTSKYAAPPAEMAAKVDQVGRQLVGTNPFLGFDPTFHAVGQPQPEICHPDSGGVFLSTGLIERCRSDAELAAVLANELAIIRTERQLADRPRRAEPMPPLPDGGRGTDPTQIGTQAIIDKKSGTEPRSSRPTAKPEDRRTVAADILKAAGFDPAALDAVEPLLAEAAKHHTMAATFGGRAGKPRWSN